MKRYTPLTLVMLLALCAGAGALTPPTMTLKDTCIAIAYCDDQTEYLAGTFEGQEDMERVLRQRGAKFTGISQNVNSLLNNPTILCYDSQGREVTLVGDTPLDTLLVELWYPECEGTPKLCTSYNDNVLQYVGDNQYIFFSNDGAFFKGAGFYATCGTQTVLGGRRETALIAGNSLDALKGAIADFIDDVSKGQYESRMKYYVDKSWATTAIVSFEEDGEAVINLLTENKDFKEDHKKKLDPIIINDFNSNLGELAEPLLNVAKGGTLKVIASAAPAFDALKGATSGHKTGDLAYQLFARLDQKSPRSISKAKVYGCQANKQELIYHYFKNDPQHLLDTTGTFGPVSVTKLLGVAENYKQSATSYYPMMDSGEIFIASRDGKYYVGKDGLSCTFDGSKLPGNCQAVVMGTSNPSYPTGNYCEDEGTGDIVEQGVYWEDYLKGKDNLGKVEFISGFMPCATTGLALEGKEYFVKPLQGDDSLQVKNCADLQITGIGKECPYNEVQSKISKDDLCTCVEIEKVADWKLVKGKTITEPVILPGMGPGPQPKRCVESEYPDKDVVTYECREGSSKGQCEQLARNSILSCTDTSCNYFKEGNYPFPEQYRYTYTFLCCPDSAPFNCLLERMEKVATPVAESACANKVKGIPDVKTADFYSEMACEESAKARGDIVLCKEKIQKTIPGGEKVDMWRCYYRYNFGEDKKENSKSKQKHQGDSANAERKRSEIPRRIVRERLVQPQVKQDTTEIDKLEIFTIYDFMLYGSEVSFGGVEIEYSKLPETEYTRLGVTDHNGYLATNDPQITQCANCVLKGNYYDSGSNSQFEGMAYYSPQSTESGTVTITIIMRERTPIAPMLLPRPTPTHTPTPPSGSIPTPTHTPTPPSGSIPTPTHTPTPPPAPSPSSNLNLPTCDEGQVSFIPSTTTPNHYTVSATFICEPITNLDLDNVYFEDFEPSTNRRITYKPASEFCSVVGSNIVCSKNFLPPNMQMRWTLYHVVEVSGKQIITTLGSISIQTPSVGTTMA